MFGITFSMKYFISILLLCTLSLSASSRGEWFSNVLTYEDFSLERRERAENRRAIGILKDDGSFEDSFNQWLCFPRKQVELIEVEVIYDEESKFIPLLSIESWDRFYEVAVDGDYRVTEPEKAFSEWSELINDAHEVCVYAAFLQVSNTIEGKPNEAWIIDRLKTDRGQWINYGGD